MTSLKESPPRFKFPKWANRVAILSIICLPILLGIGGFCLYYFGSPKHTDVGYSPKQPIAYSHRLHVTNLGMDCLYCHTGAKTTPQALIPSTQTCLNCHSTVKQGASAELAKLDESMKIGQPIPWVRIHKVPDHAHFSHAAHTTKGVGCADCHGRIDKMEKVKQVEPLSMSWCLDCHANPGPHLREQDKITKMDYVAPNDKNFEREMLKFYQIKTPEKTDCSRCHR